MARSALILTALLLVSGSFTTLVLTSGAQAQGQPQSPPQARNDLKADIDALLNALKDAPNEQTATLLEERLQATWLRAGTAVTTLLISRGLRSMKAEQWDDAVGCFNDAIVLKPDFAEAYRQRGLAKFQDGDTPGAVADLGEAVHLEPRDFLAYRSLTDIATARDDWKSAYLAWQKVMELDPKTAGGEARLRDLKQKAVGEDL
jgi:tetratricopeptide (TPR) repeat protein